MKRIVLAAAFLTMFLPLAFSQFEISEKGKAFYYTNPIVSGFNPDPSICRVGEDYYLVTSTFGFFPGLPVYHSRDLVNWKLIGYGIDRPSQLNLRDENEDVLNLFAATIRYHNGTFYIINTNTGRKDKNRNFVITATNPAGPWSEAHYIEDAPRIDPSLLFDDDGKVYYTGNDVPANPVHENERCIWAQEINTETWKLVGDKKIVLDAGDYHRGLILAGVEIQYLNHFEGPHIYKKDGMYYLCVSHGGTFWDHAVSIWKSENVFGPYEMCNDNPIVSNRSFSHEAYIHHTGHADLVQTQTGEWWMVILGCRPYGGEFTNMGRETHLVPVDWSGTWPIVNPLGPVGRVMPAHKRPDLANHPWSAENPRDNFDSKNLNLYWNFIQTPTERWWSLSDEKGKLKIEIRPETISNKCNPSFIGRRQVHKNFTASTKMEFTPKAENEIAGLIITRDVDNQFQMRCTQSKGKKMLQLYRKNVVEETDSIIAEMPISSESIYLKATALEQQFSFSYSENGKTWKVLAENIDGSMLGVGLGIGRFTGTYVGMYASSNGKESKNSALFDWFEYDGF